MGPRSYFWWLLWPHCGGLTGVCIVAVSQGVAHLVKRMSLGSILIGVHLGEAFVQSWFPLVGKESKIKCNEVISSVDYNVSFKSKSS